MHDARGSQQENGGEQQFKIRLAQNATSRSAAGMLMQNHAIGHSGRGNVFGYVLSLVWGGRNQIYEAAYDQ